MHLLINTYFGTKMHTKVNRIMLE